MVTLEVTPWESVTLTSVALVLLLTSVTKLSTEASHSSVNCTPEIPSKFVTRSGTSISPEPSQVTESGIKVTAERADCENKSVAASNKKEFLKKY